MALYGKNAVLPCPRDRFFSARIRKAATGEIRITTTPRAGGSLDHNRKLQEKTADDADTVCGAYPKVGHGALKVCKQTGEVLETKFGNRAKTTLKEFGAAVDKRFGNNAVFFTLTLPSSDVAAYAALAKWSSYVVARVTQWLRDHLKEAWYAWVWEYQKRGALHLHLVVADDDYCGLVRLLLAWRDFACDLLQQVESRAGVDLLTHSVAGRRTKDRTYIQMDAVFVQKSAARYLAKYMGKGRQGILAQAAVPPARWWRVSNRALAFIRTMRESLEIRGVSRDEVDNVVSQVVASLRHKAVALFHYANKMFEWLPNYVVWSADANHADVLWNDVLNVLDYCKYVPSSGGGGGTNPDCGLGGITDGARVATLSETFIFMNSIRSTSWSSV